MSNRHNSGTIGLSVLFTTTSNLQPKQCLAKKQAASFLHSKNKRRLKLYCHKFIYVTVKIPLQKRNSFIRCSTLISPSIFHIPAVAKAIARLEPKQSCLYGQQPLSSKALDCSLFRGTHKHSSETPRCVGTNLPPK